MGVGALNLIGKIAPVFKSNYSQDTEYKKLDVVLYSMSLWLALQDTTGNAPPEITEDTDFTQPVKNDYWQLYVPGAQIVGGNYVKVTDIAQAPTKTSQGKLGISKPDGKTITIDEDGTMHGASLDFIGTAAELKAAITAGSVTAGMTAFIRDGEIDGDGLLVEVAEGSGMSMIGKVENGEFVPYATMGEKQLGVPLFVFDTEADWQAEYDAGKVPDGSVIVLLEDNSDPVYGTVDAELSETSENPVQNKAVTAGINAVKAMRGSETEYGMVKLSAASDVTGSTGLAVPASELNAAVEGTLANKIEETKGIISQNNAGQFVVPGGIKMCWGTKGYSESSTIQFPFQFNSTPSVIITSNYNNALDIVDTMRAINVTTTGFEIVTFYKVFGNDWSKLAGRTNGAIWFAVGY